MSIFFDFVRSLLFRSKKRCYLSRISKSVSLWLFCLKKKNILEKGRFFDKSHGLTLLQNVDFFDFARTSLFRSKKNSFLSRRSKNASCWLSLLKRTDKEKVHFFGKNHGLTPFQNVDFLNIFRTYLLWSKKHSFLSRISKNVFFLLFFAQKKHMRKRSIFWQNPRTNLFAKFRRFFDFVRTSLLRCNNLFFLCRISKNVTFWLFARKKIYMKKVDFLTKTMD